MQWPNAVDEILRLESPVQLTARVCRRATELAGQPIRVGQPVTTILAAANRDPGVFADPHTFDVSRKNAGRHLAFSSGRHYCVGAALARAEGEIGLQRLFTRFPGLASAGIPVRRPTRVLRGWDLDAGTPVPVIARSGPAGTALAAPPVMTMATSSLDGVNAKVMSAGDGTSRDEEPVTGARTGTRPGRVRRVARCPVRPRVRPRRPR